MWASLSNVDSVKNNFTILRILKVKNEKLLS